MAAAGAFGVIHVHAAIADHRQRVFAEAELVDRVGMDVHGEIVAVGRHQRAVEDGRRGAEVLVDFHAERAAGDRFLHRADIHAAAPEEAEVQRELVGCADQLAEHVRSRATHVEMRTGRHADHGRRAAGQRVLALLRRQEMRVRFDAAGGDDEAVRMHDRRVRSAAQPGVDAVHHIGIAGLADGNDLAVANADVAFDDAGHGVDDRGVLHHHVERTGGVGAAGLETFAVAHALARAGGQFVAVVREVVFHFCKQRGVAEAHHVTARRPINICVRRARYFRHGQAPR